MNENTSDWLLRTLKQNPEGLLLLAAGAALFLRQGSRAPIRQSHGGPAPMPANDVGQAAASMAAVGQPATSMAGQVRDAAAPYATAASDYVRETGSTLREQSEKIGSQVYATADRTVERVVDSQPLVIALAGLAIGAAVAAALPPTAVEQSAMGPIGTRVNETAQHIATQAKDAVGAAGDTLKAAVEEKGLNVEGLKDVASDVATSFTDRLQGKTERAQKPFDQFNTPSA